MSVTEINYSQMLQIYKALRDECDIQLFVSGTSGNGWTVNMITPTSNYSLVTARGHVKRYSSLDTLMSQLERSLKSAQITVQSWRI